MAGTAELGTGRHTRNGARARARAVWLELPSWAQGDTPQMGLGQYGWNCLVGHRETHHKWG